MIGLDPGQLDRRVRIERPEADGSFDGAGSGEWSPVAVVWANVQDMLPSRGERLADGVNVAARPARVRMRFRADVTAAMRLVAVRWDAGAAAWVATGRVMQIITVPAEIGNRDGIEMMVEEYSTGSSGA